MTVDAVVCAYERFLEGEEDETPIFDTVQALQRAHACEHKDRCGIERLTAQASLSRCHLDQLRRITRFTRNASTDANKQALLNAYPYVAGMDLAPVEHLRPRVTSDVSSNEIRWMWHQLSMALHTMLPIGSASLFVMYQPAHDPFDLLELEFIQARYHEHPEFHHDVLFPKTPLLRSTQTVITESFPTCAPNVPLTHAVVLHVWAMCCDWVYTVRRLVELNQQVHAAPLQIPHVPNWKGTAIEFELVQPFIDATLGDWGK